MIFPPFSQQEWAVGDLSSEAASLPLKKVVNFQLPSLAPDLIKFLEESTFELQNVKDMMTDLLANPSDSRHDVACRWLRTNEATWGRWIPDQSSCSPGQGMFHELQNEYVDSRSANVSMIQCRPCQAGRFSKRLLDAQGLTHVCEDCPAGKSLTVAGATACEPCARGKFKNQTGTEDCGFCLQGFYQDEQGAAECKECPNGTSTLVLGSPSASNCGCASGSIDTSEGQTICTLCPEGLNCPFMSALSTLAGASPQPGIDSPTVQEGYFSTAEEPLAMYKCGMAAHCPGGKPDSCGAGLVGIPCGDCEANMYWSAGACVQCSDWAAGMWVMSFVMICIGLIAAYYLMNSPVTGKATTLMTTTASFGMMVNMMQSVGLIGMMSISWPVEMQGLMAFARFFAFDLDGLAFACMAGSQPVGRYIASVLFFPFGVSWLYTCGCISWMTKARQWAPAKLYSTMGQFFQVGFSTMSGMAMRPYICYDHPNGQRSVSSYPNIFCGSDEHTAMVIAGSLLLAIGVIGFWVVCLYAAISIPRWSCIGDTKLVQSARFLVFRFRLDVWWYGVPLLLRGPLLALCVVLWPNTPAFQVLSAGIILLIYVSVEMRAWPWKSPLLNVIDYLVSTVLTVLLFTTAFSVPDVSSEASGFLRGFMTACMGSLFGVVGLMCALTSSALVYRAGMGSRNELSILTLGKVPASTDLANSLLKLSGDSELLEKEPLIKKLDAMGVYDLRLLQQCLDLISSEIQSLERTTSARVKASAFTAPAVRATTSSRDSSISRKTQTRHTEKEMSDMPAINSTAEPEEPEIPVRASDHDQDVQTAIV